ncbi:hypothetical protein DT019_27350 [Streptomyces sp. SDr-06]|uniref:hypothetical protein n=1 Tax=Streptomyces sp. SDr-06 TaxID=2267702 RepID=UPI000DE84B78|nr:hypothetical protein [Streptomyces sp. SDr-06]RCH65508.1 hypothetical protein DT019_27350 [Streptomyces sp. SDr-06]
MCRPSTGAGRGHWQAGVAILGAILSSTCTNNRPADAPAAAAARNSIGDALAASTHDSNLLNATDNALTGAMSASVLVGAAGVVGAAILAVFLMTGEGKETTRVGLAVNVTGC